MVVREDLRPRLDACWEMGRTGRSSEGLEEARVLLLLAREQQDAPSTAFALTCLAWFCLQLGNPDEGIDFAIEAKTIYADLGLDWGLSLSSSVHCWTLLEMGLSDLGFEEAGLALEIAGRTDDLALRAFAMSCKGMTLSTTRQHGLALTTLNEALALAEKARDECTIALIYTNIGYNFCEQAHMAAASGDNNLYRDLLERAVSTTETSAIFARRYGDLWNLRTALCNCAEYYSMLGEFAAAETLLAEWRSLGGEVGSRENIQYLYTQGEILRRSERLADALVVCHEATQLALRGSHADHKLNTLRQISFVQEAAGEYQAALGNFRAYHDLFLVQMGEKTHKRAQFVEKHMETEQLRAQAMRLETEARQDVLTGLPNRRAFEATLAAVQAELFSLAILDIDHFKLVNDHYSHIVGDSVLARTGAVLLSKSAEIEVFRLGGEEFALLFRNRTTDQSVTLCEAVRSALADTHWGDLGVGLAVTVSIGVADSLEFAGRKVLEGADRRLYEAKNRGRNCVVWEARPRKSRALNAI